MAYFTDIQFDEFFPTTVSLLRGSLPISLKNFNWRRPPGKKWIVVTYRAFKYSQYELHFSSHSNNHADYFGRDHHIIIAFYFKAALNERSAWLNALAPYENQIREQLGMHVVSGLWGKQNAWLAESLDNEPRTPECFSNLFAQFIQATYKPITFAFTAIGR